MSSMPTHWSDDDGRARRAGWGLAATAVLAAHTAALIGYLALYRPAAGLAAAPVVTVEFMPPLTEPSSQTVGATSAQDAIDRKPVEEPAPQPAPSPEDTASEPEQQSASTLPPQSSEPAQQMSQPMAPSETAEQPVAVQPPVETVVERPAPAAPIRPPIAQHAKTEPHDRKKPAARPAQAASAQAAKFVAPPRHQDAASVGADDGRAAWLGELRAKLLRVKQYPAAAAAEHRTGTVQLSFTVSRDGRVLSRHIQRSSGSSALDQEVLAMIERAQPLPPFPPSMPQAQTALTVPVTFAP